MDKLLNETQNLMGVFLRHATGQETLTPDQISIYSARERSLTVQIQKRAGTSEPTERQQFWMDEAPGYNWMVPDEHQTRVIFYILTGNVGAALGSLQKLISKSWFHGEEGRLMTKLWHRWGEIDLHSTGWGEIDPPSTK